MSILGVRNKVKDFGVQVDGNPGQAQGVLTSASYVEDAMRDWARKYPFDNWLPRYAYALEGVYEEIPGAVAHARAVRQLNYIIAYFPQTMYARVGRYKEIQGIPTPNPSATPPADDALARLGMLDGRVKPTFPPNGTPSPDVVPAAPAPEGSPAQVGSPSMRAQVQPAVELTPSPSPSPHARH